MPAPVLITDLSTTAASNSPAGSEAPSVLDDVQRAHAAFIAQLRDGGAFAQPLKMALGTAALPSYTFAGDLDTGAFSPGADIYAISTGGAERLRVVNNFVQANVPVMALADAAAFCHYLRGRTGDNISAISFQTFAGAELSRMFVEAGGAWTYATSAGATIQMRMDSAGNWGFGAAPVSQKLEVTKNQNAATAVVVRNTDAGASAESILQLTNNTKFVNHAVNFNGNYYLLAGAGGIVTSFHRFDTHNWQTNGGVTTMTLSSTGLLTLVGAGATPAPNDNSKKVATTEYVKAEINRLGFTRVFKSTDQTVTPNSTLNVAHGLGARPEMFKVVLKCTTAEANFAVGDEVEPIQTVPGVSVINISADATNIIINYTGANTQVLNKTLQVATTITSANWRFVVRAYA
jgi:hypothetical protein